MPVHLTWRWLNLPDRPTYHAHTNLGTQISLTLNHLGLPELLHLRAPPRTTLDDPGECPEPGRHPDLETPGRVVEVLVGGNPA